jgi:hypothetical protein
MGRMDINLAFMVRGLKKFWKHSSSNPFRLLVLSFLLILEPPLSLCFSLSLAQQGCHLTFFDTVCMIWPFLNGEENDHL